MKSIKVILIGFILAVALVAWPAGYMQYITAGIGFLLAAVLMAWLGVHRRKSAQKEYEDDMRRYTGTTMMKVVWIEESADERWEHQKDGSDVPFPVSWTVKMKKKQKETQDILSYHTQAAGCSDKARAKASGGRQPIEECGRTGL